MASTTFARSGSISTPQASGRTVTVPAPEKGEALSITLSAPGSLALSFDPAGATLSRADADLVFTLDNGGKVTLGGFFNAGEGNLPDLVMPDGAVVSSLEFFDASAFDFTVAMGPSAVQQGSGVGDYNGDAGDLVGGVDTYGSLGTSYWAAGRERAPDFGRAPAGERPAGETETPPLPPTEDTKTPPPPPPPPPTDEKETPPPPPPPAEDDPYHARLILSGAPDSAPYGIRMQDGNGQPLTGLGDVSFEFSGNAADWIIPHYDPATGAITFTLTEAGRQALAAGEEFGTVTVKHGDESYPLYLQNPQSDDYNSAAAEAARPDSDDGSRLLSEWYESHDMVRDAEITLGGSVSNTVTITSGEHVATGSHRSGEFEEMSEDHEYYNPDWDPDWGKQLDYDRPIMHDDYTILGLRNSIIDAGTNGAVTVAAAKTGEAQTSHVAGVYGDKTVIDDSDPAHPMEKIDKTEITADTVHISARTDDGSMPYHDSGKEYWDLESWENRMSATGILSREGDVTVVGREITVEAAMRSTDLDVSDAQVAGIRVGDAPGLGNVPTLAFSAPSDDANQDAYPRGNVTLRGKEDEANTITVSAAAEYTREDIQSQYGDRTFGVYGVDAQNGSVTITGGSRSDAIIIGSSFEGDFEGNNGSYSGRVAGIRAGTDSGGSASVLIDGGNPASGTDHDRLDITVDSKVDTDLDIGGVNIRQAGIDAVNSEVTIKNIEEITIAVSAAAADRNADRDSPAAYFEQYGINAQNSSLSITNSNDMAVRVTAGQGIAMQLGHTDLAVHSDGNLTLDLEGGTGGLLTYASNDRENYPEEAVETSVTAGGNLNMKVRVTGADDLGYGTLTGVATAGSESKTVIKAGSDLKLDLSVLTQEEIASIGEINGIKTEGYNSVTEISSGGDMTLQVKVSAAGVTAEQYNEYSQIAGIYTQGSGAATNINAGGRLDLAIEVDKGQAADELPSYSILTKGGAWIHDQHQDVGASTSIISGGADDKISLTGDMAVFGGKNVIDTGCGDDTFSINGNIISESLEYNYPGEYWWSPETGNKAGVTEINMGSGRDLLVVNGDLKADAASEIRIAMGDDDDTVILNGSNISDNVSIDGGTGDDELRYILGDLLDGGMDNLGSLLDALGGDRITGFESVKIQAADNAAASQIRDYITSNYGNDFMDNYQVEIITGTGG